MGPVVLVVAGWPLLGGSGYRAWGPGSRGLWLRPFLRGVGLRPLGWGGLSQVRKQGAGRPGCLVYLLSQLFPGSLLTHPPTHTHSPSYSTCTRRVTVGRAIHVAVPVLPVSF